MEQIGTTGKPSKDQEPFDLSNNQEDLKFVILK